MRGPNVGTAMWSGQRSALSTASWWHCQQDTAVIENDGNFWISVAARQRSGWFVVGKEIAVKKYVVRLSADQRAQARILLKADVSSSAKAGATAGLPWQ
jgi:hypothetical protein